MKRFAVICGIILALSSLSASAKEKYDLGSRVSQATDVCARYVIGNAKDPASITIDPQGSYSLGSTNDRLRLFAVAQTYAPNIRATAYILTDKAKELGETYFSVSRTISIDDMPAKEKGLITCTGDAYRTPKYAIRSRTSTGANTRFKESTKTMDKV